MERFCFQQLYCASLNASGENWDPTVLDMRVVMVCSNGPVYSHEGMKMCPCLIGKLLRGVGVTSA